ncbi:hypothetical protein ASF29_00050 [Rhizobium sp. Leaf262]|nr:hypothetical protein ASF29_00050 [Rhizobium sp. Leaf262]
MRLKHFKMALVALPLFGCEAETIHFLKCTEADANGWTLVKTEKREEDGKLTSCTYQSPDQSRAYTLKCDDKGCGVAE